VVNSPRERIYLSPGARAALLWVLAGVGVLLLWQVRGLLVPLIWAAVTAYLLNPLVVGLSHRTGWPRRVWAVGIYVGLLALLALCTALVIPEMAAQVESFSQGLPNHIREAGRLIGREQIEILGVTFDFTASDERIRAQLGELGAQVGRVAVPTALPYLIDGLFKLLLYLVSAFFLLFDAERIGQIVARFTPPGARAEWGPWLARVDRLLGAYIRGQAILFLLMTAACYIVLAALDIRFAPLLAVVSGFVLLVPYVGPYIAGGASTLVALTQGYAPYGWSPVVLAIVVALAYTVLRQVEANFVMPFLIGKLVDLHPLTVIFVVLVGAALGGILGLLIAVPVATTLKIGAEYLYGKLSEKPPRTLVPIDPGDGWPEIATTVRAGVEAARRTSPGRPRLLLSVPHPPAALLDPASTHRLMALIQEAESDTILFTPDPALADIAREAGIAVSAAPFPDEEPGAGRSVGATKPEERGTERLIQGIGGRGETGKRREAGAGGERQA
jgi:predicted PurR-regulated permease PerM